MTLFAASLNSGSNGNCYYIGNGRESVLIDAGIPCRETERRMRRLGLSLTSVKAIFISHEHDDHIRGLEVLSKRYCFKQQKGLGLEFSTYEEAQADETERDVNKLSLPGEACFTAGRLRTIDRIRRISRG